MDDDRTLPFELPAAALKWALCRVFVGFRQEMTAFNAWALQAGQIGNDGKPPDLAVREGDHGGRLRGMKTHSQELCPSSSAN
jgi:hypothetical protein